MPDSEREDLSELLRRRALTEDAARPDAVDRRHAAGGRTARENIADLVDDGTFVEYGRYAIAAQRARRDVDELIARTPADGLVAGTARVNGELFGERARCAVLSYDYTVLAGTQGALGHRKKDRLFELIERMRLPDGASSPRAAAGGPGDTDLPGGLGARHARLRALGAALGAGAADRDRRRAAASRATPCIAGCSDLIVATEDSSLGMGGPAMIAGGGPRRGRPRRRRADGRCRRANGVVDVVGGRRGRRPSRWPSGCSATSRARPTPGPRPTRPACATLVPERARRAYKVAPIIETLADEGSVTFLRERFAPELVTALARDRGPADRLHRQQHDAHGRRDHQRRRRQGRPLPAALRRLRAAGRVAASTRPAAWSAPRPRRPAWSVTPPGCWSPAPRCGCPLIAVVLRRGYGLGAQAMAGGSLHEPLLTVAWPAAHLGPMGLEGAVRLGAAQGARGDRRRGRARAARARADRCGAGERQGAQRRRAVRDRRRHRPGRDAGADRRDARGRGARARPPGHGHRFVDTW